MGTTQLGDTAMRIFHAPSIITAVRRNSPRVVGYRLVEE